ncbi:MAG: orotidine-5'-phosphate decarboxylase [Acidobacteriota bacterium]
MRQHFADQLIQRIRSLRHPLCVGLDPHLDRIPDLFRQGSMQASDPRTADAVQAFLGAVLERIGSRVAVIKPQIAFFERLGWRGLKVLETVVAQARRQELLVLLDAKRGDIGSTAKGYAEAYLGGEAAIECDAMTLNPYLGCDTLAPFLSTARDHDRGLFVLVKTSNPGSGDFQDRRLEAGPRVEAGLRVFEAVADALAEPSQAMRGSLTGWSSLGVVVGATYPGQSEQIRERLPHALFLVPGYGAQGGSAEAALRGFVPGDSGMLEGGIVNSSRGILFPAGAATDHAPSWEGAIDQALERSIDELSQAAGR